MCIQKNSEKKYDILFVVPHALQRARLDVASCHERHFANVDVVAANTADALAAFKGAIFPRTH